jgi:hypothetical protein
MKGELATYMQLVSQIKPRDERNDKKGHDTVDLKVWWRGNEDKLPAFAYVLRAILTNAPNSIPPERVFSRSSTTLSTTTRIARWRIT